MNITDPMEMLAVLAHRKGGYGALARELGVSRAYLSAMKVGRKPLSNDLLKLLGLTRVVTVTYERTE